MNGKIVIAKELKVKIIIFSFLSKNDIAKGGVFWALALKVTALVPSDLKIYVFWLIFGLGIFLIIPNRQISQKRNYLVILDFLKYILKKIISKEQYMFIDEYKKEKSILLKIKEKFLSKGEIWKNIDKPQKMKK